MWLTPRGLSLVDLSHMDMGCEWEQHRQDAWVADFMSAVPTWRIDSNRLILSSAGIELAFRHESTSVG